MDMRMCARTKLSENIIVIMTNTDESKKLYKDSVRISIISLMLTVPPKR